MSEPSGEVQLTPSTHEAPQAPADIDAMLAELKNTTGLTEVQVRGHVDGIIERAVEEGKIGPELAQATFRASTAGYRKLLDGVGGDEKKLTDSNTAGHLYGLRQSALHSLMSPTAPLPPERVSRPIGFETRPMSPAPAPVAAERVSQTIGFEPPPPSATAAITSTSSGKA